MSETLSYEIEHPVQPWWDQANMELIDDEHRTAIASRYDNTRASDAYVSNIIDSVDLWTQRDHQYRFNREHQSLSSLGLRLRPWPYAPPLDESMQHEQAMYESLAGRAEKVDHFMYWFSRHSHAAFVAQEPLLPDDPRRFTDIALEIGGKRQYGDWEATERLDAMARTIPERLLAIRPDSRLVVYGNSSEPVDSSRVRYVNYVPKDYTIIPQFRHRQDGKVSFDTALVSRKRPVADWFVPGESDTVLTKESVAVLVMGMAPPKFRKQIVDDVRSHIKTMQLTNGRIPGEEPRGDGEAIAKSSNGEIVLKNTVAARIAGRLFERAIKAPDGMTTDIIPVAAHYRNGVGSRYARFRYMSAGEEFTDND